MPLHQDSTETQDVKQLNSSKENFKYTSGFCYIGGEVWEMS